MKRRCQEGAAEAKAQQNKPPAPCSVLFWPVLEHPQNRRVLSVLLPPTFFSAGYGEAAEGNEAEDIPDFDEADWIDPHWAEQHRNEESEDRGSGHVGETGAGCSEDRGSGPAVLDVWTGDMDAQVSLHESSVSNLN